MRKIKYILFGILLSFIYINNVNAYEEIMHCEYAHIYINKEQTQYIRYRINYYDDKSIIREYYQASNTSFKTFNNSLPLVGVYDNTGKIIGTISNLKDNFTSAEMQKYYEKKTCPYLLYKNTGTLDSSITPVETNNVSSYTNGNEKEITINTNNGIYVKKDDNISTPPTEEINPNATATCVYDVKYSNIEVVCQVTPNSLNCTSDLSITKNSLKISDFKNGNSLKCLDSIGVNVNNSGVISDITLSGGTDTMYYNESKSNAYMPPSSKEDYENDERYIAAKKEADKYCQSADTSGYENLKAKCEEARQIMEDVKRQYTAAENPKFDAEYFCQGPVQGVFTTLGWVFFVVKILIPILLIVFGSIDVGKAIIADKDDELKKSVKTLIVRIIAGFIIFFIPTILNVVVKMIDDKEVYNGTFWDCTKCMLDPSGNVCSTLRGN